MTQVAHLMIVFVSFWNACRRKLYVPVGVEPADGRNPSCKSPRLPAERKMVVNKNKGHTPSAIAGSPPDPQEQLVTPLPSSSSSSATETANDAAAVAPASPTKAASSGRQSPRRSAIGNLDGQPPEALYKAPPQGGTNGVFGPNRLGGVAAGTVCFILYFFFCIVFSAVIFTDDLSTVTSFGVAHGVGIVLLGIAVGCLSFAVPQCGSGCRAIIAGPDLLPIIFAQELGAVVLEYCDSEEGGATKVLPTTLVAITIGNVLVGLLFFALGRFKASAAIGFIPASVISGL